MTMSKLRVEGHRRRTEDIKQVSQRISTCLYTLADCTIPIKSSSGMNASIPFRIQDKESKPPPNSLLHTPKCYTSLQAPNSDPET
jgi:hypothetical protein